MDFVAEGIAGVASAQRRGCGLYHVVNPHWEDNVSLDSFLDWIKNAGYPLKRIPDYTQWCATWTPPISRNMSNHSCPASDKFKAVPENTHAVYAYLHADSVQCCARRQCLRW